MLKMKHPILLIAILVTGLFSCSDTTNEKMTNTDKFTWNAQLAGYDFSKYDEKGETNFQNFIDEYEKFPWLDQLDSYQEIKQGCSPTLSVKDTKTGQSFWVSMAGDRNNNNYLIGYVFPKEKKGLFGFGKPKTVRWLEIYGTHDTEVVKNCFQLFFDRDHSKLKSALSELDLFDEMEAQN
jgi:hypothetical protein